MRYGTDDTPSHWTGSAWLDSFVSDGYEGDTCFRHQTSTSHADGASLD